MKKVIRKGMILGTVKPTDGLDNAGTPLFGYYPVGLDNPTFKGRSYQSVAWYLAKFLGPVTLED